MDLHRGFFVGVTMKFWKRKIWLGWRYGGRREHVNDAEQTEIWEGRRRVNEAGGGWGLSELYVTSHHVC